MTIKNVTLSGELYNSDKIAIAEKKIEVYQLSNLFHAHVLQTLFSDPHGGYQLTYQMNGLKDHLVLLIPGLGSDSLFKRYVFISEDHPQVTIPTPPLTQKKKRSNQRSARLISSNFDELAQRTLGSDWQSKLIEQIPNRTTPLIQESYRENQIPLNEQEEINFLLNSLFWRAPKIEREGKRLRFHTTPRTSSRFDRKELPEAKIELNYKNLYHIKSVSIRYKNEDWMTCTPKDPEYKRFLYLANSTALNVGMIAKLIGWGMVLPNLYTQAYLSTISDHNPLKILLGAHLTESLLIDQHLGLPLNKPLLELAKCSGFDDEEMANIIKKQLRTPPLETPVKPSIQENFARTLQYYKMNVIRPTVSDFFEYHRYAFEEHFWGEIYQLSQTFSELHPLSSTTEQGWWNPFVKSGNAPQKGEMQKLKEWCENALLITTFLPHAIAESVNYLTDLRFASLNPVNKALQEDQTSFDPHGGTTPENAAKQLSRTTLFLQKGGIPLNELPKTYDTFKTHLENAAEVLRAYGLDPAELFTHKSSAL